MKKKGVSVAKAKKKAAKAKPSPKKTAKKSSAKKSSRGVAAKKPKAAAKSKTTKTKSKAKSNVKAKAKSTPAKKTSSTLPPALKKSAASLLKAMAPTKTLDISQFFTPLDDRLIVQVSGTERKTAGGLYIPDTVGDVSGNMEGQVLAAGRGHRDSKGRLRPMDVQVGDRVVFSQYAGDRMEIQGESVIILREGDVMGILVK